MYSSFPPFRPIRPFFLQRLNILACLALSGTLSIRVALRASKILVTEWDLLCYGAIEGSKCVRVHYLTDKHYGGLHIAEGPPRRQIISQRSQVIRWHLGI